LCNERRNTIVKVKKSEWEVGVAVEYEHTDKKEMAQKIAIDHLKEKRDYYSKLYKSGLIDELEALKLAKKY